MRIPRSLTMFRCYPAVLATMLSLAASSAIAQTPASPASLIEGAQSRLTGDSTLDDAQRETAKGLLDGAKADQASIERFMAETERLRREAEAAPEDARQLERALAVQRDDDLSTWIRALPRNADAETLEQLLTREGETLSALFAEMEQASAALADSQARPVQNAETLVALRQDVEQLSSTPVPSDEPAALAQARTLANDAKRRVREAEIQLRQTEQDTAAARQSLLELRVRELRHRLFRWAPRLDILKDRLADRSRAELAGQAEQLAERETALQPDGGARAEMASANADVGRELVDNNDRLVRERDELLETTRVRAGTRQALRDTRTRLELGGDNETVGLLLRSERVKLVPPARLSRRLDEIRHDLTEARLRLATIAQAQRESGDQDSTLAAVRADRDIASDDDAPVADADAEIGPLLRERIELLGQLENLVRRRVATLERSESTHAELLADTRELSQILDERLLWIPSHTPVETTWIASLSAGIYDLIKPARFVTTGKLLARSAQDRPLAHLGSLALVIVLFLFRWRARPHLEQLSQPGQSVRTDDYRHTGRALGWTLLAALPWATACFLLGLLLQGVGESGKYSDSLGRTLLNVAVMILVLDFLRWLSIERGLAHAHFRWTRPRRQTLQVWLPRITWVVLPAQFIIALAFIRNQDLAISTQARVAIVLLCLFVAWAMWRMLAAGALWMPRGTQPEPSTRRKVLRVAVTAVLVMTALLALVGYVYSAGILVESYSRTAGLVTAVAIVHGMVARWFLLGERRLALRRAEQKRAAERADAEASGDGDTGPDIVDEPVALESISAQTQRLLRALTLTLLVLGVLWTWSPVLPALAYLDQIQLWQYSDPANAATGGGMVTLLALIAGVVILALTFIATRNLPGLIELGLLSRINIDAASRYAITSIARYAIVMVGVIAGLGLLGLRWSQLQWLAAGLTVGLGFGLQEIFANFVSGLILLFERPFRIGDQITIGEFTGTVSRIRTRATTLQDGEGREIVVPNKSFITGQLINWTLSDTVTQVGTAIGVAYGSDVDKVHALLLKAARENPRVLDDPAPASWFQSFADGALNFELKVSVGSLADRGAVKNELNARIATLLADNGIALASPQMDLRVREMPPPSSPAIAEANAPARPQPESGQAPA
jgi:potassium efflux system protein